MVMKDYEREAELKRKEDERAQRLLDNNVDDAIKALLSAKNGRDFLWWLLYIGKVGVQPFAIDPVVMGFQCGELNVGQQVLDRIISVNPEGYLRMLKEKQDDATRREQLAAAERAASTSSEREPTDDA